MQGINGEGWKIGRMEGTWIDCESFSPSGAAGL